MEMLSAATISDKIDKRLIHDLYAISRDAMSDCYVVSGCYITIPVIDARRIVRKLILQNRLMSSEDISREVSPTFLEVNYLQHKQPIYYIKFISCLNKINLNIIEIMEEYENETPRPY